MEILDKVERVITHKNDLSFAKFEKFELREIKLLLSLISAVEPEKQSYLFDGRDIKNIIGMKQHSFKEFSSLIRKLGKREILIWSKEKEKFRIYYMFSWLEFDLEKKTIEVTYNSEFLPFLVDFTNGNFCKYYLSNVEKLNRKYSILLYIRSQAELFKKKYYLSVEEINDLFGVNYTPDKMDVKIFTPAIKEINELTDLKINIEKKYTSQKLGRSKVEGYTITVLRKKLKTEEGARLINLGNQNRYIKESGILNEETILILLKEFNVEELEKGLNYAVNRIKKKFKALSYLKRAISSSLKLGDLKIENTDEEILSLEVENQIMETLKNRKIDISIYKIMKKNQPDLYIKTLKNIKLLGGK